MRFLLTALMFTILIAPAGAETCKLVEPETFIATGVASLQAGEFKGAVLLGAEAADFAEDSDLETDTDIAAAFMIEKDHVAIFIFVNAATACMFGATDEGRADFKLRYGRDT